MHERNLCRLLFWCFAGLFHSRLHLSWVLVHIGTPTQRVLMYCQSVRWRCRYYSIQYSTVHSQSEMVVLGLYCHSDALFNTLSIRSRCILLFLDGFIVLSIDQSAAIHKHCTDVFTPVDGLAPDSVIQQNTTFTTK